MIKLRSSVWFNTDRKRAFTLVEMIIAIVLGTLLLASLMGVLRRSFSELAVATQDDPRVSRKGLLVDQLRRDMSNARSISVGNNRFELMGFGHRDPLTLVSTLLPARVIYEIRRHKKQSMLVRVQIADTPGRPFVAVPFTEAVYVGADNLVLTSNEVRAFSKLDLIGSDNAEKSRIARQQDNVPSSVQIVILDQRGRTLLDQTFTRERDTR